MRRDFDGVLLLASRLMIDDPSQNPLRAAAPSRCGTSVLFANQESTLLSIIMDQRTLSKQFIITIKLSITQGDYRSRN